MVISKKEGLHTFQGKNCFISNLASISGYYSGKELSEEVLYANGGHRYHFGSWIKEDGSVSYPTLICFDADVDKNNIVNEFAEWGMSLKRVIFEQTEEAICYIKEMISKDIPLIVNVNSYYMTHWPENIRGNYAHYIIVYGIDETDNSFLIMDNYIPDTPVKCYEGRLSYESFFKALDFTNVQVNHNRKIIWVLEKGTAEKNTLVMKQEQSRKNMIEHTYKNMTGYKEKREVKIGSFSYQYYTGIQGLVKFKEFLAGYKEKADTDEEERKIFVELYKNITSFGGPVNTLTLLSDFIKIQTLSENEKAVFSKLTDNISIIIKQWKEFGISIFRYSVTGFVSKLEKAIVQLENIITIEKENIEQMKKWRQENEAASEKTNSGFPQIAYLFPSMLCNLHCKMCYSGAHQNAELLQDEMSLDNYKHLIGELYKRGVRKFDMSGGEPFISDKFYEIIKEIKSYKDTITYVVSNGTLIKENKERIFPVLKYIDKLFISIDSLNEEIHNSIRGSKNAFSNSIEGLRLLQEMNFKNIGINFLVMADNCGQIHEILNFAKLQGYRYVNLLRLLDVPENKELYEQNLDVNRFVDIYQNVQEWVDNENQNENNLPLDITLVLPGYCIKEILPYRKGNASTDTVRLSVQFDPMKGCTAFSNSIVISSKGEFTGCTAMFTLEEFYEGSLKEKPLDDILDNWSSIKKKLDEREVYLKNIEPCKGCRHWRYCKGGCPAVTYKYYHTIMKNDPTCIMMQKGLGGK